MTNYRYYGRIRTARSQTRWWRALALAAAAAVVLTACGSSKSSTTPSASRAASHTSTPGPSASSAGSGTSSAGSGTSMAGSATSSASSGTSTSGSDPSSYERTRLAGQVSAQLNATGVPPTVVSCVIRKSGALPLPTVRDLAASNPSASANRVATGLLRSCVLAEGAGMAWVRAMIIRPIRQSMSSRAPAAFTTCLEQKVNATNPSQLASLLFPAAATQRGSTEARGRQFGIVLAEQCLAEPTLRPVLVGMFLGPVQRDLKASHYSTAFKSCLLGKLRKVPSSELVRAVTHPATAHAFGVQVGRQAAEACIASGARP